MMDPSSRIPWRVCAFLASLVTLLLLVSSPSIDGGVRNGVQARAVAGQESEFVFGGWNAGDRGVALKATVNGGGVGGRPAVVPEAGEEGVLSKVWSSVSGLVSPLGAGLLPDLGLSSLWEEKGVHSVESGGQNDVLGSVNSVFARIRDSVASWKQPKRISPAVVYETESLVPSTGSTQTGMPSETTLSKLDSILGKVLREFYSASISTEEGNDCDALLEERTSILINSLKFVLSEELCGHDATSLQGDVFCTFFNFRPKLATLLAFERKYENPVTTAFSHITRSGFCTDKVSESFDQMDFIARHIDFSLLSQLLSKSHNTKIEDEELMGKWKHQDGHQRHMEFYRFGRHVRQDREDDDENRNMKHGREEPHREHQEHDQERPGFFWAFWNRKENDYNQHWKRWIHLDREQNSPWRSWKHKKDHGDDRELRDHHDHGHRSFWKLWGHEEDGADQHKKLGNHLHHHHDEHKKFGDHLHHDHDGNEKLEALKHLRQHHGHRSFWKFWKRPEHARVESDREVHRNLWSHLGQESRGDRKEEREEMRLGSHHRNLEHVDKNPCEECYEGGVWYLTKGIKVHLAEMCRLPISSESTKACEFAKEHKSLVKAYLLAKSPIWETVESLCLKTCGPKPVSLPTADSGERIHLHERRGMNGGDRDPTFLEHAMPYVRDILPAFLADDIEPSMELRRSELLRDSFHRGSQSGRSCFKTRQREVSNLHPIVADLPLKRHWISRPNRQVAGVHPRSTSLRLRGHIAVARINAGGDSFGENPRTHFLIVHRQRVGPDVQMFSELEDQMKEFMGGDRALSDLLPDLRTGMAVFKPSHQIFKPHHQVFKPHHEHPIQSGLVRNFRISALPRVARAEAIQGAVDEKVEESESVRGDVGAAEERVEEENSVPESVEPVDEQAEEGHTLPQGIESVDDERSEEGQSVAGVVADATVGDRSGTDSLEGVEEGAVVSNEGLHAQM